MEVVAILFQLIIGIAVGMLYWIVSAGLTFTFGVTRVLNFAHGAFYMLGAYFTLTFFELSNNYIFALLFGAFLAGLVGAGCERAFISRIYRLPIPFQLILTFGLVLLFDDMVKMIWGLTPKMTSALFLGAINFFGRAIPMFSVYMIIAGILIGLLLYVVLFKTYWGVQIRAITVDAETATCYGLNPSFLYPTAFMFGSFLAGLGGGLTLPISSAAPGMGEHILVYAFIVTVIGGLGNIKGALVSAILIGVIESLGTLFVPWLTIALPYMAMSAVLLVRPEGLFGEV